MHLLVEFRAAIIFLIITIFIVYCFEEGFLRFNYPSRQKYPIHGIDISHHQGNIDWDILKQENIQFVYMKATEGLDWVDPKFKLFWKSALKKEMVVGAYHYYRFCKTGIEQANNFIAIVPKNKKSMPHAVDLEYIGNCETEKTKQKIISEISDYIIKIRDYYGKKPIIYATEEFYNDYLINQMMETKIWIRNIFFNPELPDNREWTIWQYSNRGRIKGIEKNVDLNVFHGNEIEFISFIKTEKAIAEHNKANTIDAKSRAAD